MKYFNKTLVSNCIICFAVLFFCNSHKAYSIESNSIIVQLISLENQSKLDESIATKVQKLYSHKERLVRIEARRISSVACLKNGDLESAKMHLLKVRDESKYEDGDSWDRLLMARAEISVYEEKWMEALENLEPVVKRTSPTLNSIKAAIRCGYINIQRGDYTKAKSAYMWAKDTAIRLFSDPGAEGIDMATINAGIHKANAGPKKTKVAKEKPEIDRDLLIFQQAERLFAQGKWDPAGKQYRELINEFEESMSKYVAPSTCSLATCLLNLGKIDEAIKELSVFVTQNPTGSFRGQALIALGDIYLECRLDRDAAEKAYSQASQQIEKEPALDISWQNVRYDILLRNGLMFYLKGEKAEAKNIFTNAVTFAPPPPPVLEGFEPIPQPIRLLIESCENEDALTPIKVLKCDREYEKAALLCFLSDFYILIDKTPKAFELLEKLKNAKQEKLQVNELQYAYTIYRQAEAYYRLDKFEQSYQSLNLYIEKYSQYEWTPDVLLKKGVYEYSRMKNLVTAINTFDLLASKYSKNELAVAALWYKGTALYWDGHFEAALRAYDDLNKKHPKNEFKDILNNTIIPEIKQKIQNSHGVH